MKDELKWYFQNNPKYAHLSENKLKKCFDDIDELFYSYDTIIDNKMTGLVAVRNFDIFSKKAMRKLCTLFSRLNSTRSTVCDIYYNKKWFLMK